MCTQYVLAADEYHMVISGCVLKEMFLKNKLGKLQCFLNGCIIK